MLASLAAFGVAGLVVVLLIFGLAIAIGLAQVEFVTRLRAEAPQVKHWGGVVLLIVGIWTIALGVFAEFFSRFFPV